MEFPEGRGGSILGADFGKSRGGEGSYEKSLPWGGMDIFWNHTLAEKATDTCNVRALSLMTKFSDVASSLYVTLRNKCHRGFWKSYPFNNLDFEKFDYKMGIPIVHRLGFSTYWERPPANCCKPVHFCGTHRMGHFYIFMSKSASRPRILYLFVHFSNICKMGLIKPTSR